VRLLGVDFGRRRIGLAVVDAQVGLPKPLAAIKATGTLAKDAERLRAAALREGAGMVVVGLPLDADGETAGSRVCRKLGEELLGLGVEVAYADESLTSQEAEAAMRASGLKAAEARRKSDGEAACRILERYLEGQRA
jgi:putative Holliday junction resolvase